MKLASLSIVVATAAAHGDTPSLPINAELGVPGFPDCVRAHPEIEMSVEDAAQDLGACTAHSCITALRQLAPTHRSFSAPLAAVQCARRRRSSPTPPRLDALATASLPV